MSLDLAQLETQQQDFAELHAIRVALPGRREWLRTRPANVTLAQYLEYRYWLQRILSDLIGDLGPAIIATPSLQEQRERPH